MELKNVEKLEHSQVKLTISISAEELDKGKETAYKRNRSKLQVPGFRKGKAPRKMIEKLYGDAFFLEEALNIVYPDAYDKAVEEAKLEVVGRAEVVSADPEEDGSFTIAIEVPVEPEITIGDYKGIAVEKADDTVTEEDIKKELDRLAQRAASTETVERASEQGDTVTIDFEGFVDGVAFEGGKGEDYDLKLGSNTFIPGFEDQLVGKTAGEDVTVNVTFPENYPSDDLKGKPAEFKCTVKSVSTTIVPEMDDELAKDVSEFETLDELKADIEKNIAESKKTAADRDLETKLLDKILETLEGEIPEAMYDSQVNNLMQDFAYRLQSQNMTLDSYIQAMGMDNEAFRGMFREQAERQVKVRLVLKKIAADESIEPTAEEIEAEYNRLSESYGVKAEEARQFIPEENIKTDLVVDKALDLIKSSAVVTPKAE
ncbi:MAG: trigger factor [Eubacteriales bacterium]|nr:trigger factor [Eubacteriales bacterium]